MSGINSVRAVVLWGNTFWHWHTDQISYSPGLLLLWSGYSMQIVCLCWCWAALPSGCVATDEPPTMSPETLQPQCVYHRENDSSQSAASAHFFLQPTGRKTDDPDASIYEAAGARRGRCSQGPVVHQKGTWMQKEEEAAEEEAIKCGQWESGHLTIMGTENKNES